MQDFTLKFTSERERRSSDPILREQLTFIARRALAGNRGRGWDFELLPITETYRIREDKSTVNVFTSSIRFFRRVDILPEKLERQSQDIIEFASAAGHSTRFSKPWVAEPPKVTLQETLADAADQTDDTEDAISEPEYVALEEIGEIRRGKYFDHLYGLDDQIEVLLSSVQAAIDSKMKNRFHSLLWGEPGCISRDSILKYVTRDSDGRAQNSKGGTIQNLFYRFHEIARPGKGQYIRAKTMGSEYTIASCDDFGRIVHNRIVDVIDSGIKTVFGLETDSGKVLKTTIDHEFLTPDGYVALEDLKVGDRVLANPGVPYGDGRVLKYRAEVCVKQHAAKRLKIVNGCRYYRIKKYQAVYEASQNGMSYREYINFLNTCTEAQAAELWFVPFGSEIHHIDNDPTNNQLDNLQLIENGSEHQRRFHLETSKQNLSIYAVSETIKEVWHVGEEQVYDLVCADPYRNFTANGLIVHNCGKTEILLSVSRLLTRLGVYHISLDATSTTEAGVRKELLDESNIIPQVILIEEIEKVPDNAMRWLLGVMDPRAVISQTNYRKVASRHVPALVLATANDMTQLQKMMYGALHSRFQNEIYCPRPSREVLAMILKREILKVEGGKLEWIDPTLEFCYDERHMTDPRKIVPVCLEGKDKLLDGSHQVRLRNTMRTSDKIVEDIEESKATVLTSEVDGNVLAELFS